uniref:Non-specific protein-tyrosine kinase n=1 Tax=Ditylenchus dipsaci TaxID=166011 RepID=A0A915E1M6_9BILA
MTTSPPPAPSSSSIIEVYLADGSWRSVRVDDQTSVHKIIEVVLSAGGIHPISFNHFALCLNHAPHTSNDCQWLHPCLRMPELRRRYIHSAPKGLITRFELRMRFLLARDYVQHVAWKIDEGLAIYMAALMLRQHFPSRLDKQLDFKSWNKREVGDWSSICLRHLSSTPRGNSEVECIFRFIHQLAKLTPFDVEVFKASLGTGWNGPLVEVHVGCVVGVACLTEHSKLAITLSSLQNIKSVSIQPNGSAGQTTVRLNVIAGTTLVFTLPTMSIAESFAHLVDGYHRLVLGTQQGHGTNGQTKAKLKPVKQPIGDGEGGNYAMSRNLHINRRLIRLEELLGDGQFGNVYKGVYSVNGNSTKVAVKVCKAANDDNDDTYDPNTANKFLLAEAETMAQFHHPHIIQLVGLCFPIYTASKGKLPIKWLPPESINYRKFSTQSDVYMFGVCMWEILSLGVKPWQGVRNHEVVLKVERGELLEQPPGCPSAIYTLLKAMWVVDARMRLTMPQVEHFLANLLQQIDEQVAYSQLVVPSNFHVMAKKWLEVEEETEEGYTPLNTLHNKNPALDSTLLRTLEQQRLQCDQDDKWLEEVEEKLLPAAALKCRKVGEGEGEYTAVSIAGQTGQLDRQADGVHMAVLSLVQAISSMSTNYGSQMSNEQFLANIQEIKQKTNCLLDQSEVYMKELSECDHKQVTLIRLLLNSDLRTLTKIEENMAKGTGSYFGEVGKREVLKEQEFVAFLQCDHSQVDNNSEKVLKASSSAYAVILKILSTDQFLSDIARLSTEKSTSLVECFNSIAIKYRPKRKFFTEKGFIGRTQLAVMHFNHNVDEEARGNRKVTETKNISSKALNKSVEKNIKSKADTSWKLKLLRHVVKAKFEEVEEKIQLVEEDHLDGAEENWEDTGTLISEEEDDEKNDYTENFDEYTL